MELCAERTKKGVVPEKASLFVISTEGRNLALGTGSGRNLLECRQIRFLAPLEMTGVGLEMTRDLGRVTIGCHSGLSGIFHCFRRIPDKPE